MTLVDSPSPPKHVPRSPKDLVQSVSASRLNCWQQCRLKFYFRYVLNIRKRLTPSLHIGKVAHAVLQFWNMARWKKEPFELERFKSFFDEDWQNRQTGAFINWDGEEAEQRSGTWAALQTYFAETPIKPDERPEAVEVSVEAELRGLPKLVGILDLVRQGGKIVDFKTSGKTPDAEKVQHLHETQLSFYGLLYRDATGNKESGFELHHLVKTKTPKLIVTALEPITAAQESRLLRSIKSYVEGVLRRDFVPSPGLQCSACEYFNECRAWTGKENNENLAVSVNHNRIETRDDPDW
jgi:CRISPR/Cas system-associated exonuclease Cas4 (RecB family)